MRSKPLMVLFRLSQLQTSEGAKKSCESVGSVDVSGLQDEEEERAARERRSVRMSWKDRGASGGGESCPRIEHLIEVAATTMH